MLGKIDEARLKHIKPFAGLAASERQELARVLDEFSAATGTALVSRGDYGYEFMVIEDGTADVFRDGTRIATFGPGDFFGELARVDDDSKRNASVVATSPVCVLTLSAHYMRVVREHLPGIGDQIDRAIADRNI